MAGPAVRIADVFTADDCRLALTFALAGVRCVRVLLQRQGELAPLAVICKAYM